jgi:type 1 fimbria pilin
MISTDVNRLTGNKMMMLTKQEVFWVMALAGAMLYPWQARAECRVTGGPNMNLSYDYQRDRVAGSPDPIATVRFDTELHCDAAHEISQPVLMMGPTAQGYNNQLARNIGEINMLAGGQDSVGFVWRNSINGEEKRISLGQSHPVTRKLKADGTTVRVQDSFHFYYVAGALQPGRDIAPTPLQVAYQGANGISPLYELVFPSIPLFARACSIRSERMDIDFGSVQKNDIRQSGEEPLSQVVRQQALELVCDPGTNVGFRITPARQQDNNILLGAESLGTAAKGVGVKMRYSNRAKSLREVHFGETLPWGRTSEVRSASEQSVTIPFEFYLVRTMPDIEAGKFEAQATIEMRHE